MAETAIVIWAWCCFCCVRTYQAFVRDEGIYEVYRCERCWQEHRVAVR